MSSHGPSSVVVKWEWTMLRTIAYLAEKEGMIWFNIICLKLYQFERIIWRCLSVLESILESTLKYVMLKIYIK